MKYYSKLLVSNICHTQIIISSLWQVAKNQLIMKYFSKFLVSSICQNIFITYIRKFTIANILDGISYQEI